MDMPENDPNVEPPKQTAETVNCGALDISSDWHMIPNNILNTSMGMHSSCPSTSLMNEQIRSFCDVNARNEASTSNPSRASANWMPNTALSPNVLMSTSPSMAPPHLLNRAMSCFDERHFSRMVNPFTDLGHTNANSRSEIMPRPNEALVCHAIEGITHKNEARIEGFARPPNEVKNGVAPSGTRWREEVESSGCEARDEFWGKGSKKRKRPEPKLVITENNEAAQQHNQTTSNTNEKGDEKNPTLPRIPGDKVLDPLKEDYIHIRARRGQATNSHSLAERIRREKISERMKFLQDIVPGCSKVTGKAVMLDEIINYVQSLQRQVEFLSMKLAMVNLSLDFDMEGLLAKDTRAGLSSSLDFPPDMVTSFSRMQPPQTRLIHPTTLHRPINFQLNAVSGGFSEPTSQAPGLWEDDELHNVVHNGFNGSAPLSTLD